MLARHRWITVAIAIAIAGVLVSASLAWLQRSIIDLQRQQSINEEVRRTWDAVRFEIGRAEELQDSVVAFFEAVDSVEREQFEAYAASLPPVNFQAVSFAAFVPAAGREAFERGVGAGAEPARRIWELDSGGRPIPASGREAYLPVTYVYPEASNEGELGFDLLSEPHRRRALLEAIRTGKTVRTDPIRLVQAPEQWAFLLFKPVYTRNRQTAPLDVSPPRPVGVVSVVYAFGALLEAAIRHEEIRAQRIALFDSAEPSFPVYLHYPGATARERRDLERPMSIVAALPGARSVSVVAMHHELSAVFFPDDGAASWWKEINATILATLLVGLLLTAALVWHHDRDYRMALRLKRATDEGRLLKEEAEKASSAKSRVLAAASHDLRQPIQAAALFIDGLKHSQLDPRQQRAVDYLDQSVRSVRDLLDDLLDLAKLDAGAVAPRLTSFEIGKLFERIEAEFATQALAKGLRVRFRHPQPDILVCGDFHLVVTILRNLVSNAVRYTRRGGLLVGARRRAGEAVLQVWDTGIGIHDDHLGFIYDDFYQVDNPQRDRSKGIGLGLPIARRAADVLGCRLSCRSRVGRGTLFEFVLPFAREAIEEPPLLAARALPAPVGRRFVVIEDDPLVAESLVMSLEGDGHSVSLYGSAEEALADEGVAGADGYVSDYWLPGEMDGIAFLDAVRARAGRDIRGILVTGDTSSECVERAGRAGWRVLFKPVDRSALLECLLA